MKIYGTQHYLWRAVDHQGEVLECYVFGQSRQNTENYANNRVVSDVRAYETDLSLG
ncbi:DDE-type integrase/transposase/recombinase [Algimonas arctica]|uniref:DDE-type integrase/transposase/recombinase n=1 Tax=Algimonas arctica TaxID=1479486 RepID=UPI0035710022